MPILDIHTHNLPPQPEGIISVSLHDPEAFELIVNNENQLFSVGFHPWYATSPLSEAERNLLEKAVQLKNVVAVGEAGIDLVKGAPLFVQLLNFKTHIELSEKYRLPLIIHCVKGTDVILGVHRDLKPGQKWCIHGFRLKPAPAQQLTSRGIYLSFGEHFNAETLKAVPQELLMAETDESPLSIDNIIDKFTPVIPGAFTLIRDNAARFLSI